MMTDFNKQRFMQSAALLLTLCAGVQVPHVAASSQPPSEGDLGIGSGRGPEVRVIFEFCRDPASNRVTQPLSLSSLPGLSIAYTESLTSPGKSLAFGQTFHNVHDVGENPTAQSLKKAARALCEYGLAAPQSGFTEFLQSMAYWESFDRDASPWTPQDSLDFSRCALFFGKELETLTRDMLIKRTFPKDTVDLYRLSSQKCFALANAFAMKYLSSPGPELTYLERYRAAMAVSFSQGACPQDGQTLKHLDAAIAFLAPVFEGDPYTTYTPLAMSHLYLQRYAFAQDARDLAAARSYLETFHKIAQGAILQFMFMDYESLLGDVVQKGMPEQEAFAVLAAELYDIGLREGTKYLVRNVRPLLRYYNTWTLPFKDKFTPERYTEHLNLVAHMCRTYVQDFDMRHPATLEDMADFHEALSLGIEAYDTLTSLALGTRHATSFLQHAADLHAKRLNVLGDFTGEYATTRLPQGAQAAFLFASAKAHLRAAEVTQSPTFSNTGRERAFQDIQKAISLGLVPNDAAEKALMGEILRSLPLRLSSEIQCELDWQVKTDLAQRVLPQWKAYLRFTRWYAGKNMTDEPREVLHALFLAHAASSLDKMSPKRERLENAWFATDFWDYIGISQASAEDDFLLAASSTNTVAELELMTKTAADTLKCMAAQILDEMPHKHIVTKGPRAKVLAKIYGDAASAAKEPEAARAHMKKSLEHMQQAIGSPSTLIFEGDLVPLIWSMAHIWSLPMEQEEKLALVGAASPLMPHFQRVMASRDAPLQQSVLNVIQAFMRSPRDFPTIRRVPTLGVQAQGGSHASSSSQ